TAKTAVMMTLPALMNCQGALLTSWARLHRQYPSDRLQPSPAKLAGYSLLVAGPGSTLSRLRRRVCSLPVPDLPPGLSPGRVPPAWVRVRRRGPPYVRGRGPAAPAAITGLATAEVRTGGSSVGQQRVPAGGMPWLAATGCGASGLTRGVCF